MNGTALSETRTPPRKFRVVVVDDHPIVRRGLAELIAREADLEICGEAAGTPEAVRLIKEICPDLVIIDLALQAGHGIELIEQVRLLGLNVKMLVYSIHDEALFAERALRAGALGYLNKQEPIERLKEAIRRVLGGQMWLSPAMASRLLHNLGGGQLERDPMQTLSNRELQVFEMIGEGMPTKKIAVKLHLSRKTIEAHREKIKSKMNLTNSAELSRRAVQWVLER